MSLKNQVSRAKTLLRVAELEKRRSLLQVVEARRELEQALRNVESARLHVREVAAEHATSGSEFLDRQNKSLLAAAALAHQSQIAAQCELQLRELTQEAAHKSRDVRGSERLLERRMTALTEEQLRDDQRRADEAGQLRHLRQKDGP